MSNKDNIDINELLQNLRDLDYISRQVYNEMDQKNKILQGGLSDCKACQSYIEKIKRNNKNNKKQNN